MAIIISLQDPTVQSYILYSAVLALKLLLLTLLTGLTRIAKGVFLNPEDATFLNGKVNVNDPTVERYRRTHLNDLENIPAFWLLGALYVTTNPVAAWATLLFRVYTVTRILHTIYAFVPLPQPTRIVVFSIHYAITLHMGVKVVLYYITAL